MLDIKDGCTIVEGKSDYYILRYMADITKTPNVLIVPAFGSSTMSSIIPITRALARSFHILLDSDPSGREANEKYSKLDLDAGTIVDFSTLTNGAIEPEKALEKSDLEYIQQYIGSDRKPTKKQIMHFFREALASKKDHKFSDNFTNRIADLLAALSK